MTSPLPRTPSRSNSTHAYSIVTTSTALLTRSNSTNTHLNTHSYSPSSPSTLTYSPSHRHDYRRHRHSKSLSTISLNPPSLPQPPSFENDITPPISRPRTLSDLGSLSDSGSDCSDAYDSSSENDVLVDNPLLWSNDRLSDYLVKENMQSLADVVSSSQITGREFTSVSPSVELPTALQTLPDDLLAELYNQARKLRVISFKSRIMGQSVKVLSQTSNRQPQNFKVKSMVRNLEQQSSPLLGSRARTWSTSSSSSSSSVSFAVPPSRPPIVRSVTADDQWSPGNTDTTRSSGDGRTLSMNSEHENGVKLLVNESPAVECQHLPSPSPFVGTIGDCTFPEEPSMEHLLRLDEPTYSNAVKVNSSWGAKAWEDAVEGMTIKKLPPAQNLNVDEFGLTSYVSCSPEDEEEQSKACDPEVFDSPRIAQSLEGQQADDAIDASSTSHREDVDSLRAHINCLESRIRDLEASKVATGTVADQAVNEAEGQAMFEIDLPQYLLMAGIGVCAIVVRRLMGMKT